MVRRVLVAAVVFALAVALGVGLGAVVIGDGQLTAHLRPTASITSAEPVTLAAVRPPIPEPSPTTVTEQEAADQAAGVRVRRVPEVSSGELRIVPGSSEPPEGEAPVRTVRVEVEEGLDIDDAAFAAFVMRTLNDPRGWGGDGSVAFARTDGDEPDIRVVLATPDTVDEMCAPLETNNRWSCGRYGHAALNAHNWMFATEAFRDAGGDITTYRQYLVNHEVGHLLGHQHVDCPEPGAVAPLMVQQSISLQGCEPNGWAFPDQ